MSWLSGLATAPRWPVWTRKEALRDPVGVRRILIVLAAVILLFFLQGLLHLQPAAVALTGAAAALLWVRPDVEETLRHVEWSMLFGLIFGWMSRP